MPCQRKLGQRVSLPRRRLARPGPIRERRSRRAREAAGQGERGRHGQRLESRRQPARAVVEVRPDDDGDARSPRPATVRRPGAHGRRPDHAACSQGCRRRAWSCTSLRERSVSMAPGATFIRTGGRAGDLHGRRGRRPAIVRREPGPLGEQDGGVERRDARAVRLPAGQSHAARRSTRSSSGSCRTPSWKGARSSGGG